MRTTKHCPTTPRRNPTQRLDGAGYASVPA
ncbi:MAG: hypothetical protein RIS64_4434, partial [Bacteroidota bacterium]